MTSVDKGSCLTVLKTNKDLLSVNFEKLLEYILNAVNRTQLDSVHKQIDSSLLIFETHKMYSCARNPKVKKKH